MHSFELFNNYEKHEWRLNEIPWANIDRAQIKPEYVKLARSAVMGECNSIAALHGFLNESMDEYDFAAYASIWGYQEIKHHYAFKTWLQQLGEDVEESRVEAMRAAYPPGITFAATLATNIISELTVCHVYGRLSSHVKEPVLANILALAAQDESRHAREFTHYCKRRIERHPREKPSVLETLYVYVADPQKLVKHPVSVFKGDLPQLVGGETIDDGFAYFLEIEEDNLSRLQSTIMNRFSMMTGHSMDRPAAIRRALAECYAQLEHAEPAASA